MHRIYLLSTKKHDGVTASNAIYVTGVVRSTRGLRGLFSFMSIIAEKSTRNSYLSKFVAVTTAIGAINGLFPEPVDSMPV